MANGIFIHRADSIYGDIPAEIYQFPKRYLHSARACVGDWIIYYEPRRASNARGYYAIAKVQCIIDDPSTDDMHFAIIESGSFLEFQQPLPFDGPLGILEKSILNASGRVSGKRQSAVRVIPVSDYRRITDLGLGAADGMLPRTGEMPLVGDEPVVPYAPADLYPEGLRDMGQAPLIPEGDRVRVEYSRTLRDRVFRNIVLRAYDQRCAVTGLKLINGGGRAEVEAAHIRSVEFGGPDMVSNGIALSGTAHWMFDRGLISLADDLSILVSRQVNDPGSITGLLNRSGKALEPARPSDRPHPSFLQWHRENCFKQ